MRNLIVKSLFGLVFMLLLLALALFIPAGSLRYWNAWVYLAVFATCTLLITVYLMKYDPKLLASRTKAGPSSETERNQRIIQSIASLLFIGLFVIAGLDYRFKWSDMPFGMSLIANVFVVLGLYFVFLVFKENSFTSATIEVVSEQQVIESGPYRWVRHPMYTGASFFLIFTALALGSWTALPFAIGLILTIMVRLLEEEKFLATKLPGYEAYRAKTKYRLVPFIW